MKYYIIPILVVQLCLLLTHADALMRMTEENIEDAINFSLIHMFVFHYFPEKDKECFKHIENGGKDFWIYVDTPFWQIVNHARNKAAAMERMNPEEGKPFLSKIIFEISGYTPKDVYLKWGEDKLPPNEKKELDYVSGMEYQFPINESNLEAKVILVIIDEERKKEINVEFDLSKIR